MCLIILKEPNQKIKPEFLNGVRNRNQDGWGIVWYDSDGAMHTKKGLEYKDFWSIYQRIDDRGLKAIIHFRFKTKGDINEENCHPYKVTEGLHFIHNGTLHKLPHVDDTKSDTWHFANIVLKPILEVNGVVRPDLSDVIRSTGFKVLMDEFSTTSNKLVLVDALGPVVYGDAVKHWYKTPDGLTVSNMYAWDTTQYRRSSLTYDGYGDWEDDIRYSNQKPKTNLLLPTPQEYNTYAAPGGSSQSHARFCEQVNQKNEEEAKKVAQKTETTNVLQLTTKATRSTPNIYSRDQVKTRKDIWPYVNTYCQNVTSQEVGKVITKILKLYPNIDVLRLLDEVLCVVRNKLHIATPAQVPVDSSPRKIASIATLKAAEQPKVEVLPQSLIEEVYGIEEGCFVDYLAALDPDDLYKVVTEDPINTMFALQTLLWERSGLDMEEESEYCAAVKDEIRTRINM